ncbi:MAG: two-component sensor histidine kinase [Marmoricola sp.]|nr:two-component sensor histidine kinase [Marmoricola sp.]
MSDLLRVAAASRVFTLAVIAATALIGDVGLLGLWYVAAIALAAQVASLRQAFPVRVVLLLEGCLTGVVAVWSFPEHQAALPYLAIPALIGGIAGGARYVGSVLVAEAAVLGLASWLLLGRYDADLAGAGVTWLTTGLGLGLLGTFTRHSVTSSESDASYRSALVLIRQLHSLSGRLTSGLDPADLADQAMAAVAEEIVVRQAVVMLRQGAEFTPLRYSTGAMSFPLGDAEDLVEQCWLRQQPVLGGTIVALPLSTGSERVAVILVECPTMPDKQTLARLLGRLETAAVQLSAALLFTSVHEAATAEERRRLAREVHDGVAQDVASLGYLVDNLAGSTTDPAQAADVALLRKEVSRVVTELRNSVFDLRNETAAGQGLGQSIALFARHVGSHSPLTVHVTLDESSVRLRPRVEAELLRITQEAINNARRHSEGSNLWVRCRVHPPYAEIEVTDDGAGLQSPRDDSHGLRIMHERAERVGAALQVDSPATDGRGTRVRITLD